VTDVFGKEQPSFKSSYVRFFSNVALDQTSPNARRDEFVEQFDERLE
jgi:hypothetical protein